MPAELACCPRCSTALTMPGPDPGPDPEHPGPSRVRATCDLCGRDWPAGAWSWLPLRLAAAAGVTA